MTAARIPRYTLIGLNLFLAANALAGALWVVPGLPREWLAGTPFPDYTIPAVALGVIVGLGAFSSAILFLFWPEAGTLVSAVVGAAMMVFELVEASVVGGDIWLHLLGLSPITKGLPATDVSGIPAPLGVPLPLWQQPVFFLVGMVIFVLALQLWRPRKPTEPITRAGSTVRAARQHS
jgi:hypothetical protein